MKLSFSLLGLMLTSALALTITERQNGTPDCEDGEINSASVGGPWTTSEHLFELSDYVQ